MNLIVLLIYVQLTRRYVLIGSRACGKLKDSFVSPTKQLNVHKFSNDTSTKVTRPTVSKKSVEIYSEYVETGIRGPRSVAPNDTYLYKKYCAYK